jgi:hypothetical protein
MRSLVHTAFAIVVIVTATLPTLVEAREKKRHTVEAARPVKPHSDAQDWAKIFLDHNMHNGG